MASVLDPGKPLVVHNESASTQEADARAMASDWNVTGQDIKAAFDQIRKELNVQEKAETEKERPPSAKSISTISFSKTGNREI